MAANLPQSYVKRPLFPCYDHFSCVTIGRGAYELIERSVRLSELTQIQSGTGPPYELIERSVRLSELTQIQSGTGSPYEIIKGLSDSLS